MTSLPRHLIQAVISVARICFSSREALCALLDRAGIPGHLYQPNEGQSRVAIAIKVVVELEKMGKEGEQLFKDLAREMYRLPDLPDSNVSDHDASRAALRRMRDEAIRAYVPRSKRKASHEGQFRRRRPTRKIAKSSCRIKGYTYSDWSSFSSAPYKQHDRFRHDIRDTAGKPSPRGFRDRRSTN